MTTVTVRSDDDLAAIIRDNPAGTTFVLETGIHRATDLIVKDGQSFIGQPGAVVSGARLLDSWTHSGEHWLRSGLPKALDTSSMPMAEHGVTSPGREDLFVDGVRLTRVGSMDAVTPGTWYFDAKTATAVMADDPTGHSVEMSGGSFAFAGAANNVTFQSLTIEKYATEAQIGAIHAHGNDGWSLVDCTVRYSHGQGVNLGTNMRVIGGAVVDNGQLGIGGSAADGSRIEAVEIARNNYANYDPYWEAGGIKICASTDVQIVANHIHHNAGPGVWGDINMVDLVCSENTIVENRYSGILYEISYGAQIDHNTLLRNGQIGRIGVAPANILIQNAQDVEAHDNYVEVGVGVGNGISMVYDDRGGGPLGPYATTNNHIHNNTIIHLDAGGWNGLQTGTDEATVIAWPNLWDHNHYTVPDATHPYWELGGDPRAWSGLAGLWETGSTLTVGQRAATPDPLAPAAATITLSAHGTAAGGAFAHFNLLVDGIRIGQGVTAATARDYSFTADVVPGQSHTVQVQFDNDAVIAGQDRNLIVDQITINGHPVAPTDGSVRYDRGALDGRNVTAGQKTLPWNGTLVVEAGEPWFPATAAPFSTAQIVVNGSGSAAAGTSAHFNVLVDGEKIGSASADATAREYSFTARVAADQSHTVQVQFDNDAVIAGQDRNLTVNTIMVNGHAVASTDRLVSYDKGALDGQDVTAGQATVPWNGTLVLNAAKEWFATASVASETDLQPLMGAQPLTIDPLLPPTPSVAMADLAVDAGPAVYDVPYLHDALS